MLKPTLIVMAKPPRIGFGKSRLAADLGVVEAWRINRILHAHTMRQACDRRWRTLLCVTPDSAVSLALPGVWPAGVRRIAQGGGDLGARLARALSGRCRVAVIGADCPEISRAHIASAFAALARRRFALGPSRDGGFWLLAARRGAAAAAAMAQVRWSSPHAAADVVAQLGAGDVALLARLRDIDVASDLDGLQRSAMRASRGA